MLLAKISIVHDVRSAERRELAEETTLRLDEQPSGAAVSNLSATGCLIETEVRLSPGAHVRIGLPGVGAFSAEVVRTDGQRAGCRFHRPLTPAQLETAFQSEVVIDGNWQAEPHPAAASVSDELSARSKLATVLALSGGLWAIIAVGLSRLI